MAQMLDERGTAPLTPAQSGKLQWTVCQSDIPIGWVTIAITSRPHHTAAIGYTIHPDSTGQGYATRSLRELVDTAFDPAQLALERLEAVASVDNIASHRVLEKCGFRREGIATRLLIISGQRIDHARYELLRDDARPA